MKERELNINAKNQTLTSDSKGITLIALIITIIIMLILVGVTVSIAINGGLFTSAKLATFATEMQRIKENVEVKKAQIHAKEIIEKTPQELFTEKLNNNNTEILETLKKEILYIREGMPEEKSPEDYDTGEFDNLIDGQGNVAGIYIIDKETGDGKENTYIYDEVTDTVYKIPATKIGKKVYHSYECAMQGKGGTEAEPEKKEGVIDKESDVIKVGDEYYYAPNMKGFNATTTSLVYYSEDFSSEIDVNAQEYINNGEQYQTEKDGQKYTLHDYGNKIWANAKTKSNNLECWWVWVPRYAYKVNDTKQEPPIDIIYISTDNKPLNPKYNGELPEGYIVHPAFTPSGKDGSKNLKGIWMSKYEPTYTLNYVPDGQACYEPDMSGFDPKHTYIELYNGGDTFASEVKLEGADLNSINNSKQWYDYPNKIWANVKTDANGLECWWVWIPRYAYKIIGTETDIIFIDLNNKPMDKKLHGNVLPEGYIVHPAFTPSGSDGSKNLKGIWMSKYEPSYNTTSKADSGECYAPDMSGFDTEHTYIELYNGVDAFESEVKLKGADLNTINNDKKWYDYKNRIWANIKTDANGLECWWVWIPRYAYKIVDGITEASIIFVDLDNKPIDKETYGDKLPEGYIVHPAFTPSGSDGSKNLKGIWMSKYEPSNKKEVE